MQRTKGATAERELSRLLAEQLGCEISRNLLQTRDGGFDLIGIDGWAMEVKRHESLNVSEWWRQTLEQAHRAKLKPVLAYRQSRRPWLFVIRLSDLCPTFTGDHTIQVKLEAFCMIVREQIGGQCFNFHADRCQLQQIRGLCTRLGVSTNIPAQTDIKANF